MDDKNKNEVTVKGDDYKMNILRISQNIKMGEQSGGGAYHIHALSRDQAKRGHNVTVATIGEDSTRQKIKGRSGDWSYDHIVCAETVEILGNQISIEQLRETLDVTEYDVVHLHSHFFFSTFFSSLLQSLSDIPVVITNHSLYSQSIPLWLSRAQLRTMGWITYSLSDCIFCYTDADKEALQEIGILTPVEVIPNGIDTSKFSPSGSRYQEMSNSGPNLLFVGRLVDGKQPEMVAKAFEILSDDYPECELYFCGDGPKRDQLQKLIETLGIASRTHILGEVPYSTMPSVYRGADIVVLPSKAEGFPRTILEALACGVPVVATDLPQTRDVVQQTGRIINNRSKTDIAEKISWLLSNESERIKRGERGRELVEQTYSWNRLVDETTKVMKNLSQ